MSSYAISVDFTTDIYNRLLTKGLPPQFVVEGGEQKLVTGLTFADIFKHIESEHWHRCGKHTCPHAESLYEHLHKCGNICYMKARSEGYSDKECIKAYLTGLLHDIGKPGTRRLLSKHTAFKGHGLVGGAKLEDFYTPELVEEFDLTSDDWADISTCADVHMCSYFSQHTSILHKYSANILPPSVKKMLLILRTGDQLAMVPDATYSKTMEQIREEVEAGEKEYRSTLESDMDYSVIGKKKGVLILLQGGSASGKSSFAKRLIELFGKEKCNHINRDWYMVHWTLKNNGEDDNITLDSITPELYQRCYKMYIASDKKWAPQMNQHMSRDIFDGLQRGNIVIVDTLATMFDSIETIIPQVAKDAYRISFWLHRNKLISEEESSTRLGMEMSSQLSAHGDVSLYNPFNSRINWMKSVSGSESEDGNNDWYLQTHLSISIGWTNIKNGLIYHLGEKILQMYHYNQSIPRVPVLEQTTELNLQELVQVLKDMNGIDEFFTQYAYTVSTYVPEVVGIKYIDGMNQIWQPKWAREARGRFYYVGDKFGGKVVPLKDTLQRGIEVLTKAHLDGGITETQDVDPKSWSKLDNIQQMVMRTFSGVNPTDSYLTGKVDGSLLIVNIYPRECEQYEIIKHLALSYGDKFTKTIVNHCLSLEGPIVTVSTQGTLFIGEEMQDYFLTSIQPLVDYEVKALDDWQHMVPTFVTKAIDYYSSMKLDNTEMVNMCFESYCKNRTSFTGRLHTELAVGYDHNGLNLLGVMNQGRYIPHFDLPRRVFKQPFYYHVQNTLAVYRLMAELDEVVLGTRSMDKFLENFTVDEFTSLVVHPEGFVLLTPIDGQYDYAKIKTQMYYKCHKIRPNKMQELLQLPEVCGTYYPILRNLHWFFDNLSESINALIHRTFQALTCEINKSSVFYTKQNPKARQRMDEVIDNVDNADVNKKMVVYKMMLNNKDNWSDIVKIFSEITMDIYKTSSEDMLLFTKGLLMKVEPWRPDWEARLGALFATFDDAVNSLYGIVIGFTN
ncbi:MAG: HD domain-containing protein [Proteobacteria bacterium]|nr:HD domain-containing protein [Pseudomonadota bacterium]